jgi:separase
LWGCSSGALTCHGIHDPNGTVISYLLGGAPWVLGNLWDVTDRDIDRLSIECMKNLFSSSSEEDLLSPKSICKSLTDSGDVCKLKNAVGCAPVVYGLPIGITSKM